MSNVIANYKPGVLSSYRNGWRQLRKYFLALFLIGISYIIMTIPTELAQWQLASFARPGGGNIVVFLLPLIPELYRNRYYASLALNRSI